MTSCCRNFKHDSYEFQKATTTSVKILHEYLQLHNILGSTKNRVPVNTTHPETFQNKNRSYLVQQVVYRALSFQLRSDSTVGLQRPCPDDTAQSNRACPVPLAYRRPSVAGAARQVHPNL